MLLELMRLGRRRFRSEIETVKIMKGMYDVNKEIYILKWMTAVNVQPDMTGNCLKRDLDFM